MQKKEKKIPYYFKDMTFLQKIGMVLFTIWVHSFKLVWSYFGGFLLGVVGILFYPLPKKIKNKGLYFFNNLWGKGVVVGSLVRHKVIVDPAVDFSKTYVFVGNHTSAFDIYLWQSVINTMFNWMAKRSVFNMPFVGTGGWTMGHIPVYRGGEHNMARSMQNIRSGLKRLKEGMSLAIFVEGTRSADGTLLPFKKGAFMLARQAKVPIVPIVIKNAHFVWRKRQFWINPYVPITVKILAPVDSSSKDTLATVRNLIQNELSSNN